MATRRRGPARRRKRRERRRSGVEAKDPPGLVVAASIPCAACYGPAMKRFADPAVAAVFAAYPVVLRKRLMVLRALVLDVAAKTGGVGRLTETLKWGQPSYLTPETKSGTTVRIDRLKAGG